MPVRRQRASQCMRQEEIESILHMQWRPLHQAPPYIEDYYYQAFVYKHYGKRNLKSFAPEAVRELAPTEKLAPDEIAFVKLDGLGRVPFSNVRRPRPLMDLAQADSTDQKGVDNSGRGEVGVRRLDQEPMLAARIMIEDCMALILDVQDIDRIFSAAAASGEAIENEQLLVQRRLLLIDGLSASLRLADSPILSSPHTSDSSLVTSKATFSDGVFLRLLSLPKGLVLAAQALLQIYPPSDFPHAKQQIQPNLRILWAILRHVGRLFEGQEHSKSSGVKGSHTPELTDVEQATSRVAAAVAAVLRRLHDKRSVYNAIVALTHGDLIKFGSADIQLLPLHMQTRHKGGSASSLPWLVDIFTALLQRAAEVELLPDEGSINDEDYITWKREFGILYDLVYNHMQALQQAATNARDVEGNLSRFEEIRKVVPLELVRVLLQHCAQGQSVQMKAVLASIGV